MLNHGARGHAAKDVATPKFAARAASRMALIASGASQQPMCVALAYYAYLVCMPAERTLGQKKPRAGGAS
jgi:hypothetical protein